MGAQPKDEAIHIWLQRMREQGWDVSDLVKRAIQCGARLKPEVCMPLISYCRKSSDNSYMTYSMDNECDSISGAAEHSCIVGL